MLATLEARLYVTQMRDAVAYRAERHRDRVSTLLGYSSFDAMANELAPTFSRIIPNGKGGTAEIVCRTVVPPTQVVNDDTLDGCFDEDSKPGSPERVAALSDFYAGNAGKMDAMGDHPNGKSAFIWTDDELASMLLDKLVKAVGMSERTFDLKGRID